MRSKNAYYYLFYVLAFCLRWLNKGYNDYAFRAVAVVSLLMGRNLLSFAFLFIDFHYGKAAVTLICLLLTVMLLGINYHFLYHNGKAQSIIEAFDGQYQGRRPSGWKLSGAVGYSLLSVGLFFFTAYLAHQHNVQSPSTEAPNTSYVK